MGTGEFNAGGNPAMGQYPIQGNVEIPYHFIPYLFTKGCQLPFTQCTELIRFH